MPDTDRPEAATVARPAVRAAVRAAVLLTGLGYPESPRWHDGRLWFANWGTGQVVATDLAGGHERMAGVDSPLPYSIDWLPDGRLLIIDGPRARLLRQEPDGSLALHADLSPLGDPGLGWNELVVDARGNAYVNGTRLALVTPDGTVRIVATDLAFGNGMAITPDGGTLLVAESYAHQLTAFDIAADGTLTGRRVWAALDDGVPDGICLDADGACWYADVPNRRAVRVREGGDVLDVRPTTAASRACSAVPTDAPCSSSPRTGPASSTSTSRTPRDGSSPARSRSRTPDTRAPHPTRAETAPTHPTPGGWKP